MNPPTAYYTMQRPEEKQRRKKKREVRFPAKLIALVHVTAFRRHSTKISGNSSSKSNGTESFRKIFSKFSVHPSRLSFFLEILKFRKFPIPFGISTRYESAPGPFSREQLEDDSESLESTLQWMQNNLPQFGLVWDCLFFTLASDYLENCGLVVPNFLRFSSLCLHTSQEKSSQVPCSHHAKMVFETVR